MAKCNIMICLFTKNSNKTFFLQYQGILKPAYNRVDLMEVEILNDDSEPRDFSEELKEFRRRIVMQLDGNSTFRIKSHLDDMVSISLKLK